jgi:hypothetical protein
VVFRPPWYQRCQSLRREGPTRLSVTKTTVTREEPWRSFRRAHDARRRERSHGILRLLDGQSCPEMAHWLSREETIRSGVRGISANHVHGFERFKAGRGNPASVGAGLEWRRTPAWSCGQEEASGQQIEPGPAEHLALQHLQTVDVPFDRALTPR